MKNGGGHFAPELGGHFELESGAHFKLELGGQYHWNLQFTIKNGEIVTFVKIDNTIIKIQIPPLPDIIYYCTYQLVSVMRDIN